MSLRTRHKPILNYEAPVYDEMLGPIANPITHFVKDEAANHYQANYGKGSYTELSFVVQSTIAISFLDAEL